MAVIVGSGVYTRWVIDPDEGEAKFVVGGEVVEVENLEAKLKEIGEDAKIDEMVLVPKEGAKKITITFRPLRAGDKYAVQDQASELGIVSPGSSRRMLIKRAVQSWDYPDVAWSEAILDSLDPNLEEQIYKWISWGVEPPEQDPETGLQKRPLDETTTETTTTEKPPEASSSPKTKTKNSQVSVEPSADGESA